MIAGLVRFAEFDVGCRARLAPRDGPRGQNHVFRPLRGIARRFVRARHISCRECGLADLPHVPGSCETPRMRCEGGGTKPMTGEPISPRRLGESATPAEGLSMPVERSVERSVEGRSTSVEGRGRRCANRAYLFGGFSGHQNPRSEGGESIFETRGSHLRYSGILSTIKATGGFEPHPTHK